ncbi:MAG: response regulator [Dehalococcoidia bacterium]
MPTKDRMRGRTAATIQYMPRPLWPLFFGTGDIPERRTERPGPEAVSTAYRVLIVEDESIVAMVMSSILKRAGYEPVGIAGNGQEAVRLALLHQPDVVLMDIRLKEPQPDGILAASEIRKSLNCAVIFVTAHQDPDTLTKVAGTSPDGYLTKPYANEQLFEMINKVVAKRTQQAPGEGDDSDEQPKD